MTEWQTILEGQLAANPPILTVEDAEKIYLHAPLSELMYAASERRKEQVPGNIVTFMIDRNINYTNICTINCNFCSFYRSPGHDEGYTQTLEQISARIEELEEAFKRAKKSKVTYVISIKTHSYQWLEGSAYWESPTLELPKTKENKEALKLHKEGKSKQRQGV